MDPRIAHGSVIHENCQHINNDNLDDGWSDHGLTVERPSADVTWSVQGSNLRPPGCKPGALPAELTPLETKYDYNAHRGQHGCFRAQVSFFFGVSLFVGRQRLHGARVDRNLHFVAVRRG